MITFESLDVEVYMCTSGISPGSTGQVRIWRSWVKVTVKVTGAKRSRIPISAM